MGPSNMYYVSLVTILNHIGSFMFLFEIFKVVYIQGFYIKKREREQADHDSRRSIYSVKKGHKIIIISSHNISKL